MDAYTLVIIFQMGVGDQRYATHTAKSNGIARAG